MNLFVELYLCDTRHVSLFICFSRNPVSCPDSSLPNASGDLPFAEIREGLCWSSAASFVEYVQYMSANTSLDCLWHVVFQHCSIEARYQFTQPTVVDTYYLQGGKSATGTTEVDWILQGHSELQWDKLGLWSWIWDAARERWKYHFLRIHVEFSRCGLRVWIQLQRKHI